MANWQIGEARISAIVEQTLGGLEALITKAKPEALAEIDWLAPNYVDDAGNMVGLVQCFVIETGGKLVVVDTCVGDNKDLPSNAEWNQQQFGLLEKFEAAGFDPDKVDLVLCTHLHLDHVGINTRLVDGVWQPTFKHARYLFARSEYEYWKAEAEREPVDPETLEKPFDKMRAAFHQTQIHAHEQSVEPVMAAGLAELVDPPCQPLPGIFLVPTPGHTPGHVSVAVGAGDAKALITGDSFHHPCQIARAEWATVADIDRDASTETRRTILDQLAGTDVLMLGTHFAEPNGGRIVEDGDSYRFDA
ncbi:MAG TPA: MBL fold metallo-hydrolase [Erythrobacter sp.]|nr:MBL fold metallo-hydrolase [Erythrobacter sp.]